MWALPRQPHWSIELAYLENRFHLLSEQRISILWRPPASFFFLAYRFDNRFVLSLAISSLPDGSGSPYRTPSHQDATYGNMRFFTPDHWCSRVILQRRGLKPHFFGPT